MIQTTMYTHIHTFHMTTVLLLCVIYGHEILPTVLYTLAKGYDMIICIYAKISSHNLVKSSIYIIVVDNIVCSVVLLYY